jgi:hypothetical protein
MAVTVVQRNLKGPRAQPGWLRDGAWVRLLAAWARPCHRDVHMRAGLGLAACTVGRTGLAPATVAPEFPVSSPGRTTTKGVRCVSVEQAGRGEPSPGVDVTGPSVDNTFLRGPPGTRHLVLEWLG